MGKAWERQKGESSKSYAWFEIFLELGASRKVSAVINEVEKRNELGQNIPKPKRGLYDVASRWHWSNRARAYDNYLSNLRRQEKEREYLQFEERLIDVGDEIVTAVEENVKDLRNDVSGKTNSISHALASVAKAYDIAVKDVRLLYGRSTENKETNAEVSVGAEVDTKARVEVDLTDEDFMENELEFMRKLIE